MESKYGNNVQSVKDKSIFHFADINTKNGAYKCVIVHIFCKVG